MKTELDKSCSFYSHSATLGWVGLSRAGLYRIYFYYFYDDLSTVLSMWDILKYLDSEKMFVFLHLYTTAVDLKKQKIMQDVT